jgi:XisH protein
MPRLDIIHNSVKSALIKDGWLITDDPYLIQYRRTTLYADLAAERPIAAERNGQKLVVEVKSFIGASKIQDLKEALGQYDIYRYLIEETAPERKLYIAISEVAYKTFFSQDLA